MSTFALSSVASSLAFCPSACMSWTWKGRGSISASRSPWCTSCPSRNATRINWPSTRLRTVTVFKAVTVPSPVRYTSRSPFLAAAPATGTARCAAFALAARAALCFFWPARAKRKIASSTAAPIPTTQGHRRAAPRSRRGARRSERPAALRESLLAGHERFVAGDRSVGLALEAILLPGALSALLDYGRSSAEITGSSNSRNFLSPQGFDPPRERPGPVFSRKPHARQSIPSPVVPT